MAGPLLAQQPKVDFGRDVLPIFRQNCIGCHGPSQALSGLRLDRKTSVFKDGFRRVVPGSSQNSFLYHRLIGTEFGLQMPPTGKLPDQQIAAIKAWIEQGAEWPDSLSNEAEAPPVDPKAVAAVETLRSGDRKAFLKTIAADPKLLNARGPEGSTPFMYAALYGDAPLLERLIKQGADPNLKNNAGATALMWAAGDLAKTRILVAHGANVNAISDDVRTPLMIAAGIPGGMPAVKLLLDHGASVNPTKHPDSESSPLIQAALAADPEMMQLLIDHGVDIKASGVGALVVSLEQDCQKCFDLVAQKDLDKNAFTAALQLVAYFADAKTVRMLLDRGAAVDALDPLGHTPLVYAAGSDSVPVDVVQLLIERGANVNSKSLHKNTIDTGMSVLDVARLRGDTPVTNLLVKAGATSAVRLENRPAPQPADSPKIAIERSLPLIQLADAGFTAKSGCVSCHNDSLAAMTAGLARSRGFKVNEELSRKQVTVNVSTLQHERDLMHQGTVGNGLGVDTFFPNVVGYVLIGLHAEGHPADLDTDAAVMYLKSRQMPAGNWPYTRADARPPLCSDYIGQTALAMRALQLYRPKGHEAEYDRAVARAAAWITQAKPGTTEDHLWKLLGLAWAGRDKNAIRGEQREVLAMQRSDGGWADLPTMTSNAYATGRALVALEAAGLPVSDPAYQHGMSYLLKTQMADGSWFVQTRALGFQPYFETGFPHGVNQSISAAGTSWATMALILGSPPASAKPELVAKAR
jgi:ankyrin repeat protein